MERIEIHGFGKYRNYTMSFTDGLQVIHGKNEAGKTTLLNFILAMLFGMKKAGRKRVVYDETHARYEPWEGTLYGGVLICSVNGQTYRIERNFLRNREECKIFLESTGEDVTQDFPEDARKERLFLQTLLGIDEPMFKNTLCLGDSIQKEWDKWRSETAPQFVSSSQLQTTEQAILQKADLALTHKLDDIGTDRAESKPLGEAAAKRKKISQSIEQAEINELQFQELSRQLADQEAACNRQSAEIFERKQQLAEQVAVLLRRWEEEKADLERVLHSAGGKVLETDFQAADPLVYADEERRNFETFLTQKGVLYRKAESYRSLHQAQQNFQSRMEQLQAEQEHNQALTAGYQDVTAEHVKRIEELDRMLNQELQADIQQDEASSASSGDLSAGWNWLVLTAGVVILVTAGILMFVDKPIPGVSLAVLGLIVLTMNKLLGTRKQRKRSFQVIREQTWRKTEMEQWEKELLGLLNRLEADTPRQAGIKWQRILQAREQLRVRSQELDWLKGEADKSKHRLELELAAIQEVSANCRNLVAGAAPEELERQIQEWELTIEKELSGIRLTSRLKQLTQDINRWHNRFRQMKMKVGPVEEKGPLLPTEQLDEELRAVEQLERAYLEDLAKQAALEAKVQASSEQKGKLSELLRESEYWRMQEEKWMKNREACLIAKAALEEIRVSMYREQAPQLARKVSKLAEQFTAGRYSNLRVDSQLGVRVILPDTGYTYEMEGLSQGTVDQLRFALSLAVAESTVRQGDRLPLFIDEPFLHYDDERFESALQYLINSSGQRQIIYFTHRLQDLEKLQQVADRPIRIHSL